MKLMPEFWQNKWSEMKPSLLAGGEKTVWQALSAFLKDEAFRLETELPHFLDSAATKMEPTESLSSPETGDQLSKKQFKRLNTVNNRPESEVKPENAKKSPRYEEMKAKFGTCPHCRLHHTFIGRTKELLASDNLRNCSDFISLNPQQRALIVEKKKVCANCLSWSHERKDCSREKRSCGVKSCGLLHSPLLHGTSVAYVNLLKTGGKIERTEVSKRTREKQEKCEEDVEDESHGFAKFLHLVAHKLPGRNLEMVFLLDDGSDTSLITHLMAGFLGLKGTKRLTYLMVAGESQPEGKMMLHFKVPITCNDGTEVLINCLGVETITENTNRRVDISQAYKLFPHVPEGALDRPPGGSQHPDRPGPGCPVSWWRQGQEPDGEPASYAVQLRQWLVPWWMEPQDCWLLHTVLQLCKPAEAVHGRPWTQGEAEPDQEHQLLAGAGGPQLPSAQEVCQVQKLPVLSLRGAGRNQGGAERAGAPEGSHPLRRGEEVLHRFLPDNRRPLAASG